MKVTIGKKLGLGFSLVIGFMLIGTLIGVFQMNNTINTLRQVSEEYLALAIDGTGVRANFSEIVWSTKNILLRGSNTNLIRKELEKIDRIRQEMDEWNIVVAEHLGSGKIDIPEKLRFIYNDFKDALNTFDAAWLQALPIYSEKGLVQADAFMGDKDKIVSEKITLLASEFRTRAFSELEKAVDLSKTSMLITIITIVLGTILALIVSIILSTRLRGIVIYLTNAAEKISLGELDKPIEQKSQDELGDLTMAFDRMRISLKKSMERLVK